MIEQKRNKNGTLIKPSEKMNTEKAEKVSRLKRGLPKGWSGRIASRLKVSKATVSRAINNYDTTSPVFDEAIKLIEDLQNQQIQTEQKLDELLEKNI